MESSKASILRPKLLIQVREYPYVKGAKSRSIVVEDASVTKASARIDLLYEELDKNDEARILFHR